MERTSDQKREILRSFINQRGVKIARWAKELGVAPVQDHRLILKLYNDGKIADVQVIRRLHIEICFFRLRCIL